MRFGNFLALAAAICVVAGCGDAPEIPAPVASPSLSAPAAPSSVRSCEALHSYVDSPLLRVADPTGIDEAPAEVQTAVRRSVDAIAVLLAVEHAEATGDIADEIRTIVDAAKEAKAELANGAPTSKALAILNTDVVHNARDIIAEHQGPC